jgi:hypothetical protein
MSTTKFSKSSDAEPSDDADIAAALSRAQAVEMDDKFRAAMQLQRDRADLPMAGKSKPAKIASKGG